MSDAEKMRRLDIMLLVTGLRCRTTADDFQPDFEAFETKHRRDLNVADRQLRAEFGTRSGTADGGLRDGVVAARGSEGRGVAEERVGLRAPRQRHGVRTQATQHRSADRAAQLVVVKQYAPQRKLVRAGHVHRTLIWCYQRVTVGGLCSASLRQLQRDAAPLHGEASAGGAIVGDVTR